MQSETSHVQWLVAILANLIQLTYGLQCGWISSVTPLLKSDRSPTGAPLSSEEISWLASAPSLSAVLTVPLFAILVDRWGRKTCLIGLGVMQAMCWIITLCPSTTTSLVVARIFTGLGGGGAFSIIPMYVKEISQPDIRGILGMLAIICMNIGIFVMYAMGGYLDYYTVLYLVVGLPVATVIMIVIKAPESPTYLMKIGKEDDAATTIAWLRGLRADDKRVQNEIDSIRFEDEQFKSIPNISFVGIFRHTAWRNGFSYMIILMATHGMNGAFYIVNYASTILLRAGITVSPELLGLSIPLFMIFGTLISMGTIERLGRRPLLATSFTLSVLAYAGLATTLVLRTGGAVVPDWVVTAFIALAVGAYAGGVSPIPFVIMSEMFNFQIRAKVMGVLVTLGWLGSFVQLSMFAPITENFGPHVSFICFAAINFIGVCLVVVFLPETKGKSVDQIEMDLDKTRLKK